VREGEKNVAATLIGTIKMFPLLRFESQSAFATLKHIFKTCCAKRQVPSYVAQAKSAPVEVAWAASTSPGPALDPTHCPLLASKPSMPTLRDPRPSGPMQAKAEVGRKTGGVKLAAAKAEVLVAKPAKEPEVVLSAAKEGAATKRILLSLASSLSARAPPRPPPPPPALCVLDS
jgi:hypothetical protein